MPAEIDAPRFHEADLAPGEHLVLPGAAPVAEFPKNIRQVQLPLLIGKSAEKLEDAAVCRQSLGFGTQPQAPRYVDGQIDGFICRILERAGEFLKPERIARIQASGSEEDGCRQSVAVEYRKSMEVIVLIPVVESDREDAFGRSTLQVVQCVSQADHLVIPCQKAHDLLETVCRNGRKEWVMVLVNTMKTQYPYAGFLSLAQADFRQHPVSSDR